MKLETFFVFDMDGVLVDSIGALKRAYYTFLDSFEKPASESEFNRLNGPSLREIVSFLKETHELPGGVDALFQKYRYEVEKAYEFVSPTAFAVEVLRELKMRGRKIGIASSAPRRIVDFIIKKFGFEVDASVAGDEVSHAKPHPEIYQVFKSRFGLLGRYVAVEDSINGVRSAMQAKTEVIWFSDEQSDLLVEQINSLQQLLDIDTRLAKEYEVLSSAKDVKVFLKKRCIELDDQNQKKVDAIWEEERKHKNLFNGGILCFDSFEVKGNQLFVYAYESEYKFFVAKRKDPALPYVITPLAVSGIVKSCKGVLFGRRSNQVTQYVGFLELVPSGSVSSENIVHEGVNFRNQLFQELREESGITPDQITQVQPQCLMIDRKDDVVDIGVVLMVNGAGNNRTEEYEELFWIDEEKIVEYVIENNSNIVPTSLLLLQSCSLLE